jgi:hypothetical protein
MNQKPKFKNGMTGRDLQKEIRRIRAELRKEGHHLFEGFELVPEGRRIYLKQAYMVRHLAAIHPLRTRSIRIF